MTVHDRTRLIGSTRRYNKYCICATKTTCTGHLSSIEEKIPKKDEVFFGKEERQTEKRAARETSGERNLPCRDETEHDRTRLIGSTRRYNKYCICATKTTCTGHLSSIEEKIPKKDEVFFGKEERQTEKRAARETSGERNLPCRDETEHDRTRLIGSTRIILCLRNLFQKQKLISVSE